MLSRVPTATRPSRSLHCDAAVHSGVAWSAARLFKRPSPGLYRHYKGAVYSVLGTVLHTETSKPMVLYRALDKRGEAFVRPTAMFLGVVERDGRPVTRFRRVGQSPALRSMLHRAQLPPAY